MDNYKKYKYKGLTPTQEGEIIGYALFKSGYIKEDLTEIDPICILCCLNKESMKEFAKVHSNTGEFFISAIHYSKYGNYLNDKQEFFTLN